MFKKLLLLAGVLVVCGWAFGSHAGREAVSYIKTGIKELKSSAKGVVPLNFELKRAEDMLNQLDRTDDKLITNLAQHITQLKRAEDDVETMTANIEVKRSDVQARHNEMKTTKVAGGKSSSAELAKTLALENDFKSLKRMESSLKLRQGTLDQLQVRVETIKKQREELKGQRVELATKLNQLKTDLKYLEIAEMRSKHTGGDVQITELNDLKELLKEIQSRIDSNLIEHELRFGTDKPEKASTPTPGSSAGNTKLLDEMDSYFGTTKTASEKQ